MTIEKGILEDPQVQEYLRQKEQELANKYKNNVIYFDTFHAFNLIYQNNAVIVATRIAGLTKTDLYVLISCFAAAAKSEECFTTTGVRKLLAKTFWNEVYRSVNHLYEKKLINFHKKTGRNRVFTLTENGLYVVRIYSSEITRQYYELGPQKDYTMSVPSNF